MKHFAFFGLGVALLAAFASAQTPITEYTIPYPGSRPQAIAPGPSKDTSVWFTDPGTNSIGRAIFLGNSITIVEYPIPTPDCSPLGITPGPDGAMWFTESNANKIGRIGLDGGILEFALPAPASAPNSITFGSDGGVWFTESNANQIGTIGPSPTFFIHEFPIPTPDSKPMGVVWNTDNAVWFTEFNGNKIGRIATDGTITEFAIPTPNSGPLGIGLDANLKIRFTESTANQTATFAAGVVTEYPSPIASSGLSGSAGGCFTLSQASKILCATTAGGQYFDSFFNELSTPSPSANPQGIAFSSYTNLAGFWVAEAGSGKLGHFNLGSGTNQLGLEIYTLPTLPAGQVGMPYSVSLSGGIPLPGGAWSVIPGSLPPGLTLATNSDGTATISGTPTASGTYRFTPTLTQPKNGTVAKTFTLTIADGGCAYSLSSTGQTFPSIGGSGTFAVTTAPGCAWTAVSNLPLSGNPQWIQITSSANGIGNGFVSYSVSDRLGQGQTADAFTGTITVGGQTFTIQVQPGLGNLAGGTLIPLFSEGASTSTIFTLLNLDSSSAPTLTAFYGNDGNLEPVVVTGPPNSTTAPATEAWVSHTLGPNQSYTFQTLASPTAPFVDGTAQIYGGSGYIANGVQAFAILHNDATRQEATVPQGGSGAMVVFDNTGDAQTGITVESPFSATEAPPSSPYLFPINIYDDKGVSLGTGTITLGIGQTWIPLATQFPATANKRGVVVFGRTCYTSGTFTSCPVPTSIGIRYTTSGAATTLPPPSSGTSAHFVSGGGWQTTIVAYYPGYSSFLGGPILPSITAQLNVYDDGGNPLSVPLILPQTGEAMNTSSLSRTLPLQAQLIVQTAASATDPIVTGSVQMGAAQGLNAAGFAILRYLPTGQEIAVPFGFPFGNPQPTAVLAINSLLPFDNTNGNATLVDLANPAASPASVSVTIRDEQGDQIRTDTIQLPANGHMSFDLAAKYPPGPFDLATNRPTIANGRGTIEFDGGTAPSFSYAPTSTIMVNGIRSTKMGSFAVLPVFPKYVLAPVP